MKVFGLFVILVVALVAPAHAQAQITIEVFKTTETNIVFPQDWVPYSQAGYKVVVFDLDGYRALSKELSKGLPADPALAEKTVKSRLEADNGDLRRRMQKIGVGIEQSIKYQLKSYPAIVFNNGEAVIFGETNLTRAIDAYRSSKK